MKQPNQVQRWIFPPLNASQAPQATHWEHFALLATAAAKQQKLNCSFLLKIISKEIEFITSIAYEMLKIKWYVAAMAPRKNSHWTLFQIKQSNRRKKLGHLPSIVTAHHHHHGALFVRYEHLWCPSPHRWQCSHCLRPNHRQSVPLHRRELRSRQHMAAPVNASSPTMVGQSIHPSLSIINTIFSCPFWYTFSRNSTAAAATFKLIFFCSFSLQAPPWWEMATADHRL